MKIFLSWSGHASHQVAVALRDWLPAVLPYAEPWLSAEDIDKGARWANEIAIELSEANFGVICIVPGNVDEPWLNFEAGAISKTLEHGKVAPLLIGVDRNDVEGPMGQFQSTVFERSDVHRLVTSINRSHEEPLDEDQLLRTFNACWQNLEGAIAEIDFDEEDDDEEDELDQDDLDEKEEEILLYLSENDGDDFSAEEISDVIGENLTRTKHYLNLLFEGDYIYEILSMDEGDVYGLENDGREYLVEHDLV